MDWSATEERQPFHVTLANQSTFENALYAIEKVHDSELPGETSDTSLYEDMCWGMYARRGKPIRRRVKVMDHLARLLVYDKGDVVATALLWEPNGLTVLWAKNQKYIPSDQETEYLSGLETGYRELQRQRRIFELVIGMCKKKILARIQKLVKASALAMGQSKNFFCIAEGHPQTEAVRQFLDKYEFVKDHSLADGLDDFFNAARELGPDSSPDCFVKVLFFAGCLSRSPAASKLDTVPGVTDLLFHRVQKLAAWTEACIALYYEVERLPPQYRQTIKLRQLNPPDSKTYRPHGDTVEALNAWIKQHNQQPDLQSSLQLQPFENFTEVQHTYPAANAGTPGPGTLEIPASQHCELTVGLYLWKRLSKCRTKQHAELGCSKPSCSHCNLYIEKLNEWAGRERIPNRILLRTLQVKCVPGWVMPNGPTAVRDLVLDDIGSVIDDICTAERAKGEPLKWKSRWNVHDEDSPDEDSSDDDLDWMAGRLAGPDED
ncbi:MAG: hypothetical protein Q9168_005469 [Polycauliona sp. 1 TL-2023]